MRLFHRIIAISFTLVYTGSRWFQRRFTTSGKFLVNILVISAAIGIDTRLNVAHQVFTLTAALLLLSLLWSPFFRLRHNIRRELPRYGSADQPLTYRLTLTNLHNSSQRGLGLAEDFSTSKLPIRQFFSQDITADIGTNWFDRLVGYPRWATQMQKAAGARDIQLPLDDIPANESIHLDVSLQPLRRGYLYFSRSAVTCTDPLGLFRSRCSKAASDRVLILPKRYPLPPIDLPGSRRFQQGGVTLASDIGESDEFISMRDYRPGDPLRHVHWKSLAKTGKPVVKQYQDEYFSRHALVLDTFTHEDDLVAFEAAVSVAASFAVTIDTNESLLDLLFVGTRATRITAGRSLGSTDQLLEILACVEPARRQPFRTLTESVMAHGSRVSGCICVLLAWDDARQQLLQQLTAIGIPCKVLLVGNYAMDASLNLKPMASQSEHFHIINPSRITQDLAEV